MSVIEVLSPLKTLPRNWAGINLDFQKRMANIFWNMNKKKKNIHNCEKCIFAILEYLSCRNAKNLLALIQIFCQ